MSVAKSTSHPRSGRPGPGAPRRQLQAAARRLDGKPDAAQIRMAHELAAKALANLDALVAQLAQEDADGHRRHAIRQAKHLKDARGRRRAPQTLPGYHLGRPSPTKGRTFEPTPPSVNDVLRMLAAVPTLSRVTHTPCTICGATYGQRHTIQCVTPFSERLRAVILLLWRGGFRVGCELVRLRERDLHPEQGFIHVARGKGGKTRDVVIDDWVWPMLEPWLTFRQDLPPGPLFCVIDGPTAGARPWTDTSIRRALHALAAHVGIRTRCAPHQFRHAMAIEQVLEGIPELYVSRNLGHADLGVTSQYLRGLPQSRVLQALRARPMPQITMVDALKNEGVRFKRDGTPDLMGALAVPANRKELIPA